MVLTSLNHIETFQKWLFCTNPCFSSLLFPDHICKKTVGIHFVSASLSLPRLNGKCIFCSFFKNVECLVIARHYERMLGRGGKQWYYIIYIFKRSLWLLCGKWWVCGWECWYVGTYEIVSDQLERNHYSPRKKLEM